MFPYPSGPCLTEGASATPDVCLAGQHAVQPGRLPTTPALGAAGGGHMSEGTHGHHAGA